MHHLTFEPYIDHVKQNIALKLILNGNGSAITKYIEFYFENEKMRRQLFQNELN